MSDSKELVSEGVTFRVLQPDDVDRYFVLRMHAVRESPMSLLTTPAEEEALSRADRARRIADGPDRFVVGAFAGSDLIGVAGLLRDTGEKRAFKAMLWGVYVLAEWRGKRIGRALVQDVLDRAPRIAGLRKIYLGVNAANVTAIALYESLGFETFALEKGYMFVDGQLHDEQFMAREL